MGDENMDIVKEFESVRDIPYKISMSFGTSDTSCYGKAKLLLKIFQDAGYEVRYRVCTFLWSDLNVPKNILEIPHEDEGSHVYIEVKIGNIWKIIDATWDRSLAGLLPANEWDGKSSTTPAVVVQKILSLEESAKIMHGNIDKQMFFDDIQKKW